MRGKILAGAVVALAFLIPAAPAMAQTETTGLNAQCQTVERKVYKDIRDLVKIDLDTATDTEVRILANQILSVANTESLPTLAQAIQVKLDGSADDLRKFLKADVESAWKIALRITVLQTLTGAGPNVKAATQKALDTGTVDVFLAYLNEGVYDARALDCASPSPSASTSAPTSAPTGTPSATTTASATPAPSAGAGGGEDGGEGGGLPVTGSATATAAAVGVAILLAGGAAFVIGRRRRSRFVA
ncbi:LPXTG cell wall anchor domain-containing protein [Actinoplanes sp. TBRC 11911]|uniref:LPXTG cell wall anchor domain-containing protein n=1 Tax=Actinoplanes sp. TBRC 11911 TaxID=2729386 RepID=UPI00145E20AF|nr:LPXTG cell wall anchor domain-containing protein [Actinoplanes sp. TBRC 11911]NMO49716.1 LPXTG cell wall anchor domain-containing protein [Actinoplanes sp. TBRC 11911]